MRGESHMSKRQRGLRGNMMILSFAVILLANCAYHGGVITGPKSPPEPPDYPSEPPVMRVLDLDMSPDPVREGQRVNFQATMENLSRHSGRTTIYLKDRDEIVSVIYDVLLKPGQNQVFFPESNYRFSRTDHCFTVEVDIEGTRRRVDMVREFCLHQARRGWTMNPAGLAAEGLLAEELRMNPDPA